MKNQPQIFTRVNRQNVPVPSIIIDELETSEVLEGKLREFIRDTLITELPGNKNSIGFVDLLTNGINIVAEIADCSKTRARGLMYRLNLEDNTGMLFVFSESRSRSFWMKETYIPLSIAYLDKAGMILNIEHMSPLSLDSVQSSAPAMYALEMNEGWFEKNGIDVGDVIVGIPTPGRHY